MTSSTPTVCARLRRLIPAALFAAAAALGASTLASPAIATAERVWDIGEYDDCIAAIGELGDAPTEQDRLELTEACCDFSGGVWNGTTQECRAPPATRPVPPRLSPGGEITVPLEPVPVTPTTQPFAPGPVKQG